MVKKIILIVAILLSLNTAKAQNQPVITDTLQWLKTNIEQKSSYYSGKPLRVLLDSLYGLNIKLQDYIPPNSQTLSFPDTIYTDHLQIYLGEYYNGIKGHLHDSAFWVHPGMDTLNTHIPYLYIKFSQQIPFLMKWFSYDPQGLGSSIWNTMLAEYYAPFVVGRVRIGEY